MNELDEDILEEEFQNKMLDTFYQRYWRDIKPEDIKEKEDDEENWYQFKQYLHDLADDIHNPMYEGVFLRLMYRDFIIYKMDSELLND